MMSHQYNKKKGFALLLAIIVSGLILTIGLILVDTNVKQITLSDAAVESERSFHAAYAGVECAQFWNIADVWDDGAAETNIRCIDQVQQTHTIANAYNAVEVKEIEFNWIDADSFSPSDTSYEMCTNMTVYKYFNPVASTEMTVLPATFDNRTCVPGVECTVVQSRGYNRDCGSISNIRTVEREVTVRF